MKLSDWMFQGMRLLLTNQSALKFVYDIGSLVQRLLKETREF